MSVLLYSSETMIWRENEWPRIRVVQMDNLRGLLDIRRMDKAPNTRIRTGNDRIAKRVYVGECVGSRLVGRSRKRWIDSMKKCLKTRSLSVRQARKMMYDRNEWRGFTRRNV